MELTKSELRVKIRQGRIGRKVRFDISPLLDSPEFRESQVVASYRSYGDEPDTSELNREILAAGKILLLPELLPDKDLRFIRWDGSGELKTNGRFEVPLGDTFEGEIDLIIVPSLAIDLTGARLGQGGGSYDRVMSRLNSWSVALIYGEELVEKIPTEGHDIPVQAALLPDRLVRF